MLTYNQTLHREYLKSPVWQAKRLEALTHYGCICSRCKEHGTDVHHKTYARWGGNELMEDLEVMCRLCHDVHHRIERATQTRAKRKKRGLHVRGTIKYLTQAQNQALIQRFNLPSIVSLRQALYMGNNSITKAAAHMLGCDHIYGSGTSPGSTHRYGSIKNERARNNRRHWTKISC